MTKNTRIWIRGLAAALIGGGSSAVTATVSASLIAPGTFNVGSQLHNFLTLAGATFIIGGLLHTAGYLSQSPIPQEETTITTTTTITAPAANATGAGK
jgi:hypothetical protein